MKLLDSQVTTCHPWPLVKSQSHHLLPPWAVTGRGTARSPSAWLWDGNLRWPFVHMFPYWTWPAGAMAPLESSPASHHVKQNGADRKTTTSRADICWHVEHIHEVIKHGWSVPMYVRTQTAEQGLPWYALMFVHLLRFIPSPWQSVFFQTTALGSRAGVKNPSGTSSTQASSLQ